MKTMFFDSSTIKKILSILLVYCFGLYHPNVQAQEPTQELWTTQVNHAEASVVFMSGDSGFRIRFRYPEYVKGLLVGIEAILNDTPLPVANDEIGPQLSESAFMASGGTFGPPPIPPDRFTPPGPGWEWRPTNQPVGGPVGGWYNPGSGETLHPDLNHPQPKGPHWGWRDPYGNFWDYFPNPAPGSWKPSPSHPNNPSKPQPTFPPETLPPPEVIPVVPLVPVVPVPVTPIPSNPPPVVPPVRPWMPWLPRFPLIPLFYFDLDLLGVDPTLA